MSTSLVALDELKRCLDNTAPISNYEDLGLFYFAKRFFPSQFELPFGQVHYKLANTIFGLYDPMYRSRMERQGYAMVARGMAKTTFGTFLLPIYNIFLKGHKTAVRMYKAGWEGGTGIDTWEVKTFELGENFILICSETGSSAENFVMNIKNVIDNRTDLIPWFGDKHPSVLQVDEQSTRRGDLIWRKNAFITSDETIVYGLGSGQQVRGRNVLNRRPTLFIVDDMYSELNTKTEDSRAKLDKWFYAAAKNTIDPIHGKMVLLGTMVHEDTVFKAIKKSDQWKGIEVPLIEGAELEETIKNHCKKRGMFLEIPSKSECDKIEGTLKTLAWKEQYSLHMILSMFKEAYQKGKENDFYQEFMNLVKRDTERTIPKETFRPVEMQLERRRGQHILRVYMDGRWWESLAEFYGGLDIASSQKKKADDTVLAYCGIGRFVAPIPGTDKNETRILPYIYNVDGGKYGMYSMTEQESPNGRAIIGWVNKLMQYSEAYTCEMMTVEIAGQSETMFNEAYRYLHQMGARVTLNPQPASNQMNKEERIMNTLLPIAQRYRRILLNRDCEKNDKFLTQLEWLGNDGEHDDYPDSVAYAFMYAQPPMRKILEVDPRVQRERDRINGKLVKDWEVM